MPRLISASSLGALFILLVLSISGSFLDYLIIGIYLQEINLKYTTAVQNEQNRIEQNLIDNYPALVIHTMNGIRANCTKTQKYLQIKALANKIPRHCTHFWYAFLTLIKLAKFSQNVTIYLEDI